MPVNERLSVLGDKLRKLSQFYPEGNPNKALLNDAADELDRLTVLSKESK